MAVVTTVSGCPLYTYVYVHRTGRDGIVTWGAISRWTFIAIVEAHTHRSNATACDLCPPHRYSYPSIHHNRRAASFGVVRPRESCPRSLVADEEEDDARHVMILINILIYAIERPLLLPPCRLHLLYQWANQIRTRPIGRHGV